MVTARANAEDDTPNDDIGDDASLRSRSATAVVHVDLCMNHLCDKKIKAKDRRVV